MYENCSTISVAGPATPSKVLGQSDFTTCTPGTSLSKVSNPTGLYLDPSGTLWVADSSNQRVLRFDNVASKSNGASADGFLGVTGSSQCKKNKFGNPGSITGDGSTLWVADTNHHRVLVFSQCSFQSKFCGCRLCHW